MKKGAAKRVEVACFTDAYPADLACRFLRLGGVKATVPSPLFVGQKFNSPQRRIYVPEDQAATARRMLASVTAGDFAGDDPRGDTRRSAGAALAETTAPEAGFVPPGPWKRRAPLILVVAVILMALFGWPLADRIRPDSPVGGARESGLPNGSGTVASDHQPLPRD